ncbi:hypothetical protein [Hyphomicrobium sp. MC8b]|uniref:hypothetical protein n=1 Tax=Hyphomicrobium sp. MC8b TaxID=300273 RepID=UPI00391A89C7
MTSLIPSRAETLGVKPKVILALTKKQLAFHRERLTSLAAPYADVDNSVHGALAELLHAFDEFEAHVTDTAAWLYREPGT